MRHKIKIVSVLILSVMLGWFTGNIVGQIRNPETVTVYSNDSEAVTFGLPFRKNKSANNQEGMKVVPLGMTIGVRINTEGVMVLGTGSFLGEDGKSHTPSDGILRGGDLILQANEKPIDNKETLSRLVADST